ncbi:ubiquinol-cytochrome C reductase hinge protein-domain-containing protein [Phialemonium atrogriseum]|uniref:Cytochrome b-c1 complex subunit 6, mitochondrial n=1 Tax=Phialemonium atrogriseum TaxID=1093897 RepID=A0AAJ0C2T0_9PEZI|nr:ubiquinol-cytochrome C reductase hinge protein-domain-containing protein [Phialemonium atrogriseum]KAK1767674.1 ubiquinol-cytochrome C reductase hinge protein-domain-containing protein [Phialemonium atrogriseum]
MGIWDTITDLVEAATPWSTAEAEAPAQEEQAAAEESPDTKEEAAEPEAEEEPAEEEEEEEEEDEDEIVDPKEKLEEECKESKQCAPSKHHFDECVERVTKGSDDGEAGEDCVEEFFHLAHCASACAAPKLWSVLK